jgi:hypothetical protein
MYVNGGYWALGSFYTSGSNQSTWFSPPGGGGAYMATHINSYYTTQQLDPFLRSRNGVTVGASACFHWV